MLNQFIHRPVLSIVISLLITLLGGLAIVQLPMTQFPDIAPPEVTVTTKYTGANAESCIKAVVTPLERAINGVPGMAYMSSVSGNDGTSVINIIFKAGTDPEIAAVNVQNRVASVLDEMPQEVIKSGVIVEKVQNSMLMYLNLLSTDKNLDEKFLYNYTDINILPELKRIEGVGFADIMGQREYAMRVWLNPLKMNSYEISAEDVVQSLKEQNVEAAPGKVGESSGKKEQSLQYVIKYTGKYSTKEQYENVVIKRNADGQILHLKDIAEVEFGSLGYDILSKENGNPSAAIVLKQRPGSNASDVIKNIKIKMNELQKGFPAGVTYTTSYDVSNFLDASIHEVLKTLMEAFFLVALIVFIFLGDFRSTLIPAIAVPVSLIGTFFFMQLFGFSINLITLFALVLAIGIVVDNAIVVVEAVHAKMEEHHIGAKQATELAMKEMGGAIVAITLVMSAVFIPVAFMSGPVGIFYRQFSVTLAISIVLSGISALTLTPALCAMLLKNTHGQARKKNLLNRFLDAFNNNYNKLEKKYRDILVKIVNRRVVTTLSLLVFCLFTWGIAGVLPSGFIPNEDQGTIYTSVTTPSGATLERTEEILNEIQSVASEIKEIKSVSSLVGYNFITDGTGASYGMKLMSLKNWNERELTDQQIIQILKDKTAYIKDAKIEFFTPPPVPGYGNSSGFELRILDKTGKGDLKAIEQTAHQFSAELNKRPEIKNAFSSFDASFPQYLIHIDNTKAAQKGVVIREALSTLQTFLGSDYATNFIKFGQMYKVMVQAAPEYRAKPEDLLKLTVKNRDGNMVAISSFLNIQKVYGPEQITRYNMYPSAMVNGEPQNGFSSGQAIDAIKQVAAEKLPKGYGFDWAGSSKEQANAGNDAIYIFLICLIFVYLILAAQYESFVLPLPIILSLPPGIFGAFFLLAVMGLENNIYAQVAMVMLIGLLGKNAVLIVEFAVQKNREGYSPYQAAIEGARLRLRPILMTSFAFIAGLLPLLFASGAGAIGNKTIGAASAGGMLLGTVFGILIIPGLYFMFETISSRYVHPHQIESNPLTEEINHHDQTK
ncbi:MAG: efflux RND transporter permease subunit [Bacteroidia bacterium]